MFSRRGRVTGLRYRQRPVKSDSERAARELGQIVQTLVKMQRKLNSVDVDRDVQRIIDEADAALGVTIEEIDGAIGYLESGEDW